MRRRVDCLWSAPRLALGTLLLALVMACTVVPSTISAPAAAPATESRWRSGVYPGSDRSLDYVNGFAEYRRRTVDVISVFPSRETWDALAYSTAEVDRYAGFPGLLSVAMPLLPDDRQSNLSEVANGEHDEKFRSAATNLVIAGRGDSDIRLGWEFNGDWPWRAQDPTTFRSAFRRVAQIFRDASPDFTIHWNGNGLPSRTSGNPFRDMYPGDDWVDIIGVDLYDFDPDATATPERFAAWADRPQGLNDWFAFAVARRKKFAVPEWGADGMNAKGDNPGYVSGMHAFFTQHSKSIAYEAYFANPPTRNNSLFQPNQLPGVSAAYESLWAVTDQ